MTKNTRKTTPAGANELVESDLAKAQGGLEIELIKAQVTSYQLGALDKDSPSEALRTQQQNTR